MAGETCTSPGVFMRGGCYALALYLADRTDHVLYGCYDANSVLHHAFVYDPETETGFDGRGRVSLQSVRHYRGLACAGTDIRPAPRGDIEAAEAEMARLRPTPREIHRFVLRGPYPTLKRARRSPTPNREVPDAA